jgi:hypothetical protein
MRVHRKCCGLDVHKKMIAACLLTEDAEGNSVVEKRLFGTMTRELHQLAQWLCATQVTAVAIAYASHCTSLGRCEPFSINFSLFDNLTPLAFRGGLAPGSS